MANSRTSRKWVSAVAASVLAAAIAGCGSSGGGGGDTAVAPPTTPTTPGITAPSGTSPVNAASISATQWATFAPVVKIGSVTISSPPTVTFSIADANNNPVVGIGMTTQASTATVPSLAFLRFSIAKLVPGTNGSPSKWVSYIVTTVPTVTVGVGPRFHGLSVRSRTSPG